MLCALFLLGKERKVEFNVFPKRQLRHTQMLRAGAGVVLGYKKMTSESSVNTVKSVALVRLC